MLKIRESLNNKYQYILNKIYYILDGKKKRSLRLDFFLNNFFTNQEKKFIIQVGGNDGINSDPLRKYLKKKINGKVIIIEPLKFYYKKLKKLYSKRDSIKIFNVAISNKKTKKKIYYIDPATAKRMDGTGPSKGWAHGQGSFDKNIIIYWIKKNSFRGEKYRNNIKKYFKSIKSTFIKTKKISNYKIPKNYLSLLIIDVQGFELEVITGIDWSNSPDFIIYEDDLEINKNKSNSLRKILSQKNYKYLGGKYDKIFFKKNNNTSSFFSK